MVHTVLGDRALWLRKAHKLSLGGLARRIGMSRGYLNKIEHGNAGYPSLKTLLKLCAFYEVTPDYLLGFDRDEKQLEALVEHKGKLVYFRPQPNGPTPRKCIECDRLLIVGKTHSFSDCITFSFHRGRTLGYLIQRWGLPKDAIELIVRQTLAQLSFVAGLEGDK